MANRLPVRHTESQERRRPGRRRARKAQIRALPSPRGTEKPSPPGSPACGELRKGPLRPPRSRGAHRERSHDRANSATPLRYFQHARGWSPRPLCRREPATAGKGRLSSRRQFLRIRCCLMNTALRMNTAKQALTGKATAIGQSLPPARSAPSPGSGSGVDRQRTASKHGRPVARLHMHTGRQARVWRWSGGGARPAHVAPSSSPAAEARLRPADSSSAEPGHRRPGSLR